MDDADEPAERLPRGRMGRLGLAGDDGGGSAQRRRRCAGGDGVTAVEELTRIDSSVAITVAAHHSLYGFVLFVDLELGVVLAVLIGELGRSSECI